VEHVRRGLAEHALAAGASTADAAQLAGFDSTRRLRQALNRQASSPAG
jgi:methylphosphotriester-DNA--protein-cysteine methyltransferase